MKLKGPVNIDRLIDEKKLKTIKSAKNFSKVFDEFCEQLVKGKITSFIDTVDNLNHNFDILSEYFSEPFFTLIKEYDEGRLNENQLTEIIDMDELCHARLLFLTELFELYQLRVEDLIQNTTLNEQEKKAVLNREYYTEGVLSLGAILKKPMIGEEKIYFKLIDLLKETKAQIKNSSFNFSQKTYELNKILKHTLKISEFDKDLKGFKTIKNFKPILKSDKKKYQHLFNVEENPSKMTETVLDIILAFEYQFHKKDVVAYKNRVRQFRSIMPLSKSEQVKLRLMDYVFNQRFMLWTQTYTLFLKRVEELKLDTDLSDSDKSAQLNKEFMIKGIFSNEFLSPHMELIGADLILNKALGKLSDPDFKELGSIKEKVRAFNKVLKELTQCNLKKLDEIEPIEYLDDMINWHRDSGQALVSEALLKIKRCFEQRSVPLKYQRELIFLHYCLFDSKMDLLDTHDKVELCGLLISRFLSMLSADTEIAKENSIEQDVHKRFWSTAVQEKQKRLRRYHMAQEEGTEVFEAIETNRTSNEMVRDQRIQKNKRSKKTIIASEADQSSLKSTDSNSVKGKGFFGGLASIFRDLIKCLSRVFTCFFGIEEGTKMSVDMLPVAQKAFTRSNKSSTQHTDPQKDIASPPKNTLRSSSSHERRSASRIRQKPSRK